MDLFVIHVGDFDNSYSRGSEIDLQHIPRKGAIIQGTLSLGVEDKTPPGNFPADELRRPTTRRKFYYVATYRRASRRFTLYTRNVKHIDVCISRAVGEEFVDPLIWDYCIDDLMHDASDRLKSWDQLLQTELIKTYILLPWIQATVGLFTRKNISVLAGPGAERSLSFAGCTSRHIGDRAASLRRVARKRNKQYQATYVAQIACPVESALLNAACR